MKKVLYLNNKNLTDINSYLFIESIHYEWQKIEKIDL